MSGGIYEIAKKDAATVNTTEGMTNNFAK